MNLVSDWRNAQLGRWLLILTTLVGLWTPGMVDAQIIRSYENLDRTAGDGYYATAILLFDGATGNAEFIDTDLSASFGYRGSRHWMRLYPASRFKWSDGETALNSQSIHFRHSLFLTDRMRTFTFAQWQAEEAIDLDRRFLLGGGIRYQIIPLGSGGVDLGVGAMLDDERRTGSDPESQVRGANLLTVYGTAGSATLSTTTYFQPAMGTWGDHRILVLGTIIVPLVDHFSLDVSPYWRRDSRPPPSIKEHDAGLKVGFRLDIS